MVRASLGSSKPEMEWSGVVVDQTHEYLSGSNPKPKSKCQFTRPSIHPSFHPSGRAGEEYRVREALSLLLLPSANAPIQLIAIWPRCGLEKEAANLVKPNDVNQQFPLSLSLCYCGLSVRLSPNTKKSLFVRRERERGLGGRTIEQARTLAAN